MLITFVALVTNHGWLWKTHCKLPLDEILGIAPPSLAFNTCRTKNPIYLAFRDIQIAQNICSLFLVTGSQQCLTQIPPPGCSPPRQKSSHLEKGQKCRYEPQPSVDTSHSGSFQINIVLMSIKQQMTVGAHHMWALSNKVSHCKDENKSNASEGLSCYTFANRRRWMWRITR